LEKEARVRLSGQKEVHLAKAEGGRGKPAPGRWELLVERAGTFDRRKEAKFLRSYVRKVQLLFRGSDAKGTIRTLKEKKSMKGISEKNHI